MFPSKRLGNVAAPANREMRCENVRQRLGGNFAPLHRFPIRPQKSWAMVVPVEFTERLMAVSARTAPIPVDHFCPDQAVMRICSELAEALLPASLTLWPAGAPAKAQVRATG